MNYRSKIIAQKSPHIAILTQETGELKNESIRMLAGELQNGGATVDIIPFKECAVLQPSGFLKHSSGTIYNPQDYDFVIKRTWGPDRVEGLTHYLRFLSAGAQGLNNDNAIFLSHSKIGMQKYFSSHGVAMPEASPISARELETSPTDDLLQSIKEKFGGVFILKGETGTRADNVRLIDLHRNGAAIFKDFVKEYHENHPGKGMVAQAYIQTLPDVNDNQYYRINIIDGKMQSAVSFTDHFDKKGKLLGVDHKLDRPADITPDIEQAAAPLLRVPFFRQGVWGIDMMQAPGQEPVILEINDGPNISLIAKIGREAAVQNDAALACQNFASAHAQSVLERCKQKQNSIA